MERKRYVAFINSVGTGTEKKEIKWNYLDEDSEASAIFSSNTSPSIIPSILVNHNVFSVDGQSYKKDECFAAWIDVNLIAFLKNESGNLKLVLAAGGSLRTSLIFDEKDYGNYLVNLLALIRKQFPNPEDVINQTITRFFDTEL